MPSTANVGPLKRFREKVHESPKIMTIPLVILSILAVVAGYILYKKYHIIDADGAFWQGSIYVSERSYEILDKAHHTPKMIKYLPVFLGFIAFFIALLFYVKNTALPAKVASKLSALYNFFYNKWYFDEAYNFALINPSFKLGYSFWREGGYRLDR